MPTDSISLHVGNRRLKRIGNRLFSPGGKCIAGNISAAQCIYLGASPAAANDDIQPTKPYTSTLVAPCLDPAISKQTAGCFCVSAIMLLQALGWAHFVRF